MNSDERYEYVQKAFDTLYISPDTVVGDMSIMEYRWDVEIALGNHQLDLCVLKSDEWLRGIIIMPDDSLQKGLSLPVDIPEDTVMKILKDIDLTVIEKPKKAGGVRLSMQIETKTISCRLFMNHTHRFKNKKWVRLIEAILSILSHIIKHEPDNERRIQLKSILVENGFS